MGMQACRMLAFKSKDLIGQNISSECLIILQFYSAAFIPLRLVLTFGTEKWKAYILNVISSTRSQYMNQTILKHQTPTLNKLSDR